MYHVHVNTAGLHASAAMGLSGRLFARTTPANSDELIWDCASRPASAGPTARGTPAGASCPSTPPGLPSSIAGVSVPDPDLDPLVR
jgi:hypothetical protein